MKIVDQHLWRAGTLFLLYLALTGCSSVQSRNDGKPYVPFHSASAIEDRIIVARVFAPVSDIEPGDNTTLVTAPFLGTSPLELPDSDKISPILQLARRVSTLASIRNNGSGSKDLFSRSGGRVRGLRVTHRLLYRSWQDVYADFPLVEKAKLRSYSTQSSKGIALAKWSVEYFFDVSTDGKAYRIILTGAHFIEHRKPEEPDDEFGEEKPLDGSAAFFGAVTYRYPDSVRAKVMTVSVVFKLFQQEDRFVYTGGEQSSGWLPLQPGKRGPYNLYLSMVHATNFRTLLDEAGGFEGFLRWLLGVSR